MTLGGALRAGRCCAILHIQHIGRRRLTSPGSVSIPVLYKVLAGG
jgi:hypothetical protein